MIATVIKKNVVSRLIAQLLDEAMGMCFDPIKIQEIKKKTRGNDKKTLEAVVDEIISRKIDTASDSLLQYIEDLIKENEEQKDLILHKEKHIKFLIKRLKKLEG